MEVWNHQDRKSRGWAKFNNLIHMTRMRLRQMEHSQGDRSTLLRPSSRESSRSFDWRRADNVPQGRKEGSR
eukprot:scaffold4049_cov204-Alexandrium_tamarense.AAC.22